jgi:hypothetical protein
MVATMAVGIGAAVDLGGAAVIWMPALACLGVVYQFRLMQMRVDATPAGLVIRREFKKRTIAWTEIEGFRTGDGWQNRGVFAVLREDGVVKLPLGSFRGADERARLVLEGHRTHAA